MKARMTIDKERINEYKRACLRYKREYIVRGLFTRWLTIYWQQRCMSEEGYRKVCEFSAKKYQQEIDRYKKMGI